jgi:prepilin-type N-terminal cleavage/methylation domain-containing protein
MKNEKGVTLTELLVALTIFSAVMAGVYSLYAAQVRHSTREYRLAESETELGIARTIIERDIMMAGYGIAEDYSPLSITQVSMSATEAVTNSSYDSLTLRGTAIGIMSRTSQEWSYITETGSPVIVRTWADDRENIANYDKVIYMEPSTRKILTSGTTAIFSYPDKPSSVDKGTLVYGLHSEEAIVPYYTVQYLVGGTSPSICAPGTKSLLRAESCNNDPPSSANREPILNCVRDLQVAFGIDTSSPEDGVIDVWDNGGTIALTYGNDVLKSRVKQVRIYVLVQSGNRDPDYTYANPDNQDNPDTIRVGDGTLGTGRDIKLTPEQRHYRWRVLSLSIAPRNLR